MVRYVTLGFHDFLRRIIGHEAEAQDVFLQTGSGKTYTMMGEINEIEGKLNEDCGITPRIFEYLFTRIRAVGKLNCFLFR